ncbi:PF07588 family protein [Leptospira noguchii str. 1993005606]|uniref:PF07588 family protein n=1 Tax=Leptospira noguchii str. 2007001578 TaxID=1049974 RepID=A0ABN0J2W1_9LEPT|nr:DUF1554 domain-containing protein [Leptospira noguchii]EMN01089.1 PF07588 family protein [Leptospira noguchii str. 2007001578]EPE84344.1 PF07588 family protein [Leptospira noguchii str. 1993005606]
MKIKYKVAIVSAFSLVFVACLNQSSGNNNTVLGGLISLISDKQTLDSTTLNRNQLSRQNLQSAFPEGYIPYIFTTSSLGLDSIGNFGGISGADAYCQSRIPSNIPSGIYKAMIVDGINRVATTVGPNSKVGQRDWVLRGIQKYIRAEDGATIMITNSSGMVDLTYFGSSLENSFSQIAATQWTGLNSDWTTWQVGGVPTYLQYLEYF